MAVCSFQDFEEIGIDLFLGDYGTRSLPMQAEPSPLNPISVGSEALRNSPMRDPGEFLKAISIWNNAPAFIKNHSADFCKNALLGVVRESVWNEGLFGI
ncbi:MAG TPA: hypothetical protein DCP63_10330 [Bacteroidetes bacterium]|nr:hypothetical protein [Bacteroidota bacterium]